MNFSSAFKYPFHNFAKVMSIVLALTIAFAVASFRDDGELA